MGEIGKELAVGMPRLGHEREPFRIPTCPIRTIRENLPAAGGGQGHPALEMFYSRLGNGFCDCRISAV
jgi:hypothetical protein